MSKRITAVLILAACVMLFVGLVPVRAQKYDVAVKKYEGGSDGAWLGVYLQNLTGDLKEAMDLESEEGVLVAGVVEDSPAEEAGLEEEDLVTEFDGTQVKTSSQLTKLVKKRLPGDEITLKLVRDGKTKTLTVVLGKQPKDKTLGLKETTPWLNFSGVPGEPGLYSFSMFSGNRIGVRVQNLTDQLGSYFGVEDGQGALVTEVEEDMPAEKAGLKAGDVIVKVDGDDIEDTGDLIEAISEKEEGDKAEITVIRDHASKSFSVGVEEGPSWYSRDAGDLNEYKLFLDKAHAPHALRLEESSSGLQDQLDELKEDLKQLKEEIRELKKELR
jgi:membrane-associated protease RseP (regulator of RpoE activity)